MESERTSLTLDDIEADVIGYMYSIMQDEMVAASHRIEAASMIIAIVESKRSRPLTPDRMASALLKTRPKEKS